MKNNKHPHWLFPLLLVIYEISLYLSNDMYLSALPAMMHDLSLTTADAQLTVTMWFLGSAVTPLMMGVMADRYGRRPTLLIGGIIFILATALCAVAANEFALLLPRIVEGAMVPTMMVAGYAVIHESYEHKEAIRILAIMGAVSVLAPALGPLGGAIILLYASWRAIFWFIVVMSSIMIFLLYRYMPETLQPEQKQFLHFKTIVNNYWQVIANKKFLQLLAVLGLTFAGFISWITAGPLLIIESFKYSEIMYGWMQAAVFIAFIIGSYFVNVLLERYNAYKIIHIALFICLISGLFITVFSLTFPAIFYLFLIAVVIYSFGAALAFAPLNRLIIETSNQPMGIRVALFSAGLMVSGVIGSSVASFIYDGTSFSLGIIITTGIVLACLLQYSVSR